MNPARISILTLKLMGYFVVWTACSVNVLIYWVICLTFTDKLFSYYEQNIIIIMILHAFKLLPRCSGQPGQPMARLILTIPPSSTPGFGWNRSYHCKQKKKFWVFFFKYISVSYQANFKDNKNYFEIEIIIKTSEAIDVSWKWLTQKH